MSEARMVPAWCAGRPVDIAVKPSPPDQRRVACPSCAAKKGDYCVDLVDGGTLWSGHAARRELAMRLWGGER